MATITPAERELLQTCVHEASHAVAGVVLGVPLSTTVALGGGHGHTVFSGDHVHGTVDRIMFAGPYGEAKFDAGGRRPTQRQVHAALDGHGHRDRNVLTASGGLQNGREVEPLIDRCWPAVIRVAQVLHRHGEADEKAVLAALGVTDGGGRTSVQLAAIRSGCRSVPPVARKTLTPA